MSFIRKYLVHFLVLFVAVAGGSFFSNQAQACTPEKITATLNGTTLEFRSSVSGCVASSYVRLNIYKDSKPLEVTGKNDQRVSSSGSLNIVQTLEKVTDGEYSAQVFLIVTSPNSSKPIGSIFKFPVKDGKLSGTGTTTNPVKPGTGTTPAPAPKPVDDSTKPAEGECKGQPLLREGSTDTACVKKMKTLLSEKLGLNDSNSSSFKPDSQDFGKFDASTTAAVKEWQKLKGIKRDGIVGPQTWATLLCKDWDAEKLVCNDKPGASEDNPPKDPGVTDSDAPLSKEECERLKRDIAEFGEGEVVSSLLTSRCYTPGGLVSRATSWLLGLAGGLAVLFFAFGGFRYMTSVGNPEGVKSAKQIMRWALLGLAAVLLAYTIVTLVKNLTTASNIL